MSQPATYGGSVGLRPQISNSGEAVIRDNTGRIITWNAGGPGRVAAGTSSGFASDTGNRPGISTDGTAIAFSGNKSGTGSAIYALVTPTGFDPILVPVAGGPVIEASGDVFGSFTSEQRVGVCAFHYPLAGNGSEDRFTVIFQGSRNGVAGVYSRDIVVVNGVVGPFGQSTQLVRTGEALGGSTITGFTLYHPVNELGTIAFSVTLADGSSAIVAQKPPIAFSRVTELSHVTNPDNGVDEPLQPKPAAGLLGRLEAFAGGLVADGVTPWIIRPVGAAPGSSVEISFQSLEGGTLLNRNLAQRLRVLNGPNWQPGIAASVSTSGECFGYLEGINPADISLAAGSRELTVTVRVKGGGLDAATSFKIRKPPVVLVHGYNTDGIWGDDFTATLAGDRPNEFVIPIQYGVIQVNGTPDPFLNKYKSLFECSVLLTAELMQKVEDPASGLRAKWAFSRYDAVGHSQGGVLLRMLSSVRQNAGVRAFKDQANLNRGRFRRIVTIGSPHNGSRFVRYLSQLNDLHGLFSLAPNYLAFAGILQNKFDPWGTQIQDLNNPTGRWIPDDDAKFLMIRTTINGGFPPGHPLSLSVPAYVVVGLNISGGSTVLPNGADGVVDLDSQGYAAAEGNVFDMPNSFISHSAPLWLFRAASNQVKDTGVAEKVRMAFNDQFNFGRFTLPPVMDNSIRNAIDLAAATTVVIGHAIVLALPAPLPDAPQPAPENGVYSLMLVPPAGKEVVGIVDWSVEVFGPDGVSNDGVTLTVSPQDSLRVTVTVGPEVVGDVLLYARYGLANGGVALVSPLKVVSIAPAGLTLSSISLDPAVASLPKGTSVIVHLWANYSDGSRLLIFPDPTSATFSSLTPVTAEVTEQGSVTLKAEGIATIQANYQGRTVHAQFTVTPGSIPMVTIPAPLVATAGQPFQFGVQASNVPTSFGATGLPPGLEIDPNSGLISGTPTVSSGQFVVKVDAANAVGIGTGTITITISISLASWRQLHFQTTVNTGDAADLADPDQDGLKNIVEFAFGLNPTRGDSLPLPHPQRVGENFVLSFTPPAGIGGVAYGAEWSPTLSEGNWLPIPDTGSNGLHTFSVPIGGNSKMFVRLRINVL